MLNTSAPGADRGARAILAFDTAGSACSVAVSRADAVLKHGRREMRHGHAEALLPMIDRVVKDAGLAPADIEVVAVSTGPGGFTGIRAGLAAAQGLALAARSRLIGVTSFAAVAALVPAKDAPLLVALDSRRTDLYVQLFDSARDPQGEPAAIRPDALASRIVALIGDVPLRIAGDAAADAAAALAGRPGIETIARSAPDALGVLAACARLLPFTEAPSSPRALYLRPPDVSFPKSPSFIAAGPP
jgi:tRNA threonylcarbamoyladenosine biosynthesis protein TsaB